MRQSRHIWRHCQRKQNLQSDEKTRFSFCRSEHRTIHYQKNEDLKIKKLLLTATAQARPTLPKPITATCNRFMVPPWGRKEEKSSSLKIPTIRGMYKRKNDEVQEWGQPPRTDGRIASAPSPILPISCPILHTSKNSLPPIAPLAYHNLRPSHARGFDRDTA